MFCPECGEPKQTGNFCRKCGFSLNLDTPQESSVASASKRSPQRLQPQAELPEPFLLVRQPTPAYLNFGEAIGTCFRKFAVFQGRATRSEYWYWVLLQVSVFVFSIFVELGTGDPTLGNVVWGLFLLVTFLPSLAVQVRRLHDTGKSGWWILIQAIPFLGSIVVLIFTLQYSEEFDNEYGQAPR